MKKDQKRKLLKNELKNGSKYAYVCTTVYPDIAGAVIIDGKIFPAHSDAVFHRGEVVICRKSENGTAEIPVL